MNKPPLYLHIGDGKTGTSIIQKLLDVKPYKFHNFLYSCFFQEYFTKGRIQNHAS